jgi:hypothetical protein
MRLSTPLLGQTISSTARHARRARAFPRFPFFGTWLAFATNGEERFAYRSAALKDRSGGIAEGQFDHSPVLENAAKHEACMQNDGTEGSKRSQQGT